MLRLIGLHPAAAVAVVAVDTMLFGASAATLGVGWLASIPVALALGAAVALVQRRAPGHDRGLAIGKGLIVAILTAIPTPLPSFLVAGAGVAGALELWKKPKPPKPGLPPPAA